MQKTVNVKIKISLKSSAIIQDLDVHYFKDYCFSYIIFSKVQTQGFNTKESKLKKSKPKDLKLVNRNISTLLHLNSTEPGKSFCQNKEKEFLKKKRDQENSISTIRNNVIKSGEKKRGNKKYYNYQKKSHFAKNCLKLL